MELGLWDFMARSEEYRGRFAPLSFPGTDVFVVSFSVTSRATYDGVLDRWYPMIRQHMPDPPRILVATKVDLRGDAGTAEKLKAKNDTFITKEEGQKLARQIGAAAYLETSALTGHNVQALFDKCVELAQRRLKSPKTSRCTLM